MDSVANTLDQVAEKIRFADGYMPRQSAIDEFRMICRDQQSLDPAWEAAKRDIVLVNPYAAISTR
jgi:hypothetical protein